MSILVTGGTGYIGSHTCVELINAGHDVIVLDNFYNSNVCVADKIKKITNKAIKIYPGDIRDFKLLEKIFSENQIEFVIHFAGLKSVSESCEKPLLYFDNNVNGTINLCNIMQKFAVKNLIFSSSATVYGNSSNAPYKEAMPTGQVCNPYGRTKYFIEEILKDIYASDKSCNITILRYFNPIGAHESALLGENPLGIPNNLMPYIVRVATGKLECLSVFGDDYDTKDGTGVRDYIHVVDLAKGHVLALEKAKDLSIYNLGTGEGYSVLDLVKTFERVNNVKVNYKIVGRRAGDIAACYADNTKAREELGFAPSKTLEDMCRDSYTYILRNND